MENNDLKKYSVFQNLEKAKICTDPFPHIIIENALNEEIHKNISDNFPGENNSLNINNTDFECAEDMFLGNDFHQSLLIH